MSERKKIAIVTGASSGMGRAFVQQIMDKYRRLDEIWVIARHLQKEMWQERFETKIVLLPLDLLQEAQQKRLRCRLFAEDVRVKILVNAAGMGRIGTFEEITLPEHQQTTRLNDEALMTVTYLCLPYMEKGSHIIQMASASAFVPQPGFAVYAASKAYVLSFSRALRSEVRKKGITVTCVCPGPVDTAFFEGAEKYHKMPLFKKKSMADPKPVVEKAVYDAACGRALSIYGWSMKALFLACKILPHRLIIDLTAIFFKP